jgi:hypothetical protein
MAQEGNLGITRAPERYDEEPSKEELQRRMEEARESIATTVTEIKENVANKVEDVKDALDWREHFKKQPLAWTLGAAGVGFMTGYGIAACVKSTFFEEEDEPDQLREYSMPAPPTYSAQPVHPEQSLSEALGKTNGEHGPGLIERFKETSAYDRLSKEASSLGDRFVEELSKTAHTVVLPLVLAKIKNWIGLDLSDKEEARDTSRNPQPRNEARRERETGSTYEPVLERPI